MCIYGGQGAEEGVKLFWGIGADGSVVISDNLEVIKASCAKSFAPFPTGNVFLSFCLAMLVKPGTTTSRKKQTNKESKLFLVMHLVKFVNIDHCVRLLSLAKSRP